MFAYLEEREEASKGATDTAKDLESEVQKKKHLSQRVSSAKRVRSLDLQRDKNSWLNTNFVQAKNKMPKSKSKKAGKLAVEKAAARQEVHVQAETFANDIASKVIGRSIA